MFRAKIQVSPILATRFDPSCHNGLITLKIEVPWYIWQELLTHKRLARNASSRRAMSAQRLSDQFGYYIPGEFYTQGKGMGSGELLVDENSEAAYKIFQSVFSYCREAAEELAKLGVSKTQANRVFPFFTMIHGIVTGTEDAWEKVIELRMHKAADPDMQLLFSKIKIMIENIGWAYESFHVPFLDRSIFDGKETESAYCLSDKLKSAARISRVSYSPLPGTITKKTDEQLATEHLTNGHLSPFEHIAMWRSNPLPSCLCSKPEDTLEIAAQTWGWTSMRAEAESW